MNKGKKNVLLLGSASLLNDFSSEMIKPLLPLMIISLGGGSVLIGLLNGLRNFISFALRIFFGYFSDYMRKRKAWIVTGYGVSALFKSLIAFSTTPVEVVGFGAIERLGKSIRTAPREALIAESMPKKKGIGFGIDLFMDRIGAILGTVSVAILIEFMTIKSIILLASAIAITALLPLIFISEFKIKKLKKKFVKSIKTLSPKIKSFLIVIGVFSVGNIGLFFTILKAKEILGVNTTPIILYALFNIIYALFTIPFGKFGDKHRRQSLVIGLTLFSLSSFIFAFSKDIYSLLAAFVTLGLGYSMTMGNLRAYITEIAKENEKATALGTAETVQGIVALPTAITAGVLWNISSTVAFIYSAVPLAVAAVMVYLDK